MSIIPQESKERKFVKDIVVKASDAKIVRVCSNIKYKVGILLETPRVYITADWIVKKEEFFYFAKNYIVQMIRDFSRDDAGKLLNIYYYKRNYENYILAKLDWGI